ncbi:MAG: helix-turn-helix domain-containing protein [Lachnospiraceae bacterium]|nr:helix-turn-helix domain-containing protein [Lachnospiraceae bacterium]
MKLLIVDKDRDVMKKTAQMIRRSNKTIEITGRVTNTQEALQSVITNPPDAALISKELKKGDGFHVAEEIKRLVPDIGIVFYMENEKSNDMKRALDAGALAMMRPPINKKRLIPVLEAMDERLKREKERNVIDSHNKELLVSANELVEFSFIYSLLFNGSMDWNYTRYREVFPIKDFGYVLYIACDKEDCMVSRKLSYDRYAKIIKNMVPEGYLCVVSPPITRRIIVLVLATEDRKKEKHLERVEQVKFAEGIKKAFRFLFDINVRIGMGSERGLEKLPISYEEAIHDIRYDNSELIRYKEEMVEEEARHFYVEMEEEMLQSVRAGNNEGLNNFMVILDLLDRYHPDEKKNKIMELLVLAAREARKEGRHEVEYMNCLELGQALVMLPSDEVNAWALSIMSFIINQIKESQDVHSFDSIRKVLQHIEKHYEEEFMLEEAARMANMSPQYFSRIFKERTGNNYVEYLTKLRMKKAMEWFDCSNQNIQEVCYRVGYKDPNYFTRVFKKVNGMTPKQYMERRSR